MSLPSISDFIFGSIPSLLLVALLYRFFRKWADAQIDRRATQTVEKMKAELDRQNQLELTDLRAKLEENRLLHSSAHASFLAAQKEAMERRLDCVDVLWSEVIWFRRALPSVVPYLDVLTDEEYATAAEHPVGQELFAHISDASVMSLMDANQHHRRLGHGELLDTEEILPYVDDYLWGLFAAYRGITLRILMVLVWHKDKGTDIRWYREPHTRRLIEATLSSEELRELDGASFGKISKFGDIMESRILTEIRKTISGEQLGEESLQQAQKLQELAKEALGGLSG